MSTFRRFSAIPAIAALVFSVSGSFAAAQGTWNVLGQYQYVISSGTSDSTLTSTSDWFYGVNTYYRTGTAGTAPTGPGAVYTGASALDFTGTAYSTTGTVGSGASAVYNYISKSAVTNTTNLITNTPMQTGNPAPANLNPNFYVAGQGMNYIVQDAGNPLTAVNGSNFRIRSSPQSEINITGASSTAPSNTSRGITFLGYTSVAPTTLSSGTYVFATALGQNGNDSNYYTDSFRAAIQDTTGQWWLSAWKTGTYASSQPALPYTFDMNTGAYSNGSTGTASPFAVTGTTQGWYQYTPATIASGNLALLDTSTATFSPYFTGTAQAFGIYFGQLTPTPTGSASPQGGIGFRWRGFEVLNAPAAVPEPATVGMTALGLCALMATRAARRRRV